ncbi:PopZ family protein [Hoeflea poritis]|uniref:DUF2497 domain-containing protein n=1 Tax=Hoeflea poritis TaxID=2993659 RepID=A0ABT4VPQ0_9HYPH|nr:DUF2497 domain-containing protein [Hoeflea poritis]MDA4846680.1 DUF2497 domain-containing protein [Hoeflea poritis]
MAQANVAHEPSMEEILASIRKIIEEGDDPETAAAAQAAPVAKKPAAVEGSSAIEEPVAPIKAANEPRRPEQPKAGPVVSRDVQRGDAASAAAQPKERKSASAPRGLPGDPGRSTRPEAAPTKRPVSLARLAAQVDSETDRDDTSHIAAPANDPPSLRSVGEAGNNGEAGKGQQSMTTQSEASLLGAHDSRALISQEAGDKVAASFDNLSHAVVNGPSRSFDEIAEDMLRPMLQQWLDDNLPTLVERLVREEIERVARGR